MNQAEKYFEELSNDLSQQPNIISGQMFGKRCLKVHKKAFLALFKEALVFKLSGSAHKEALQMPGATLWDPSGKKRPMKEWVEVPSQNADKWNELTKEAVDYVESLRSS